MVVKNDYAFAFPFLMYRVELKGEGKAQKREKELGVPNVPCGVERHIPPALPLVEIRRCS